MNLKPFWLAPALLLPACSAAPPAPFEPTEQVAEPACVPSTCGASTCGVIPDGCGGVVHCGTCTDPRTGCYFPTNVIPMQSSAGCTGTFLLCPGQRAGVDGTGCAAADAVIAKDPASCAQWVRSCL